MVSTDHPLSETSYAYNSVYLDTEPAGELLFYGQGAGGIPTSSSVISDIVSLGVSEQGCFRKEETIVLKKIGEIRTRYYIRFMAKDKPGVLAMIAKILSVHNISIASVHQKERKKGKLVPIIMLTHEAQEADMRRALLKIDNLPGVKNPSQVIRIENL
jgi:homoserine dehydrogenase